jgi:hypothetical protein
MTTTVTWSLVFPGLQAQISQPVQNPGDNYFYQRVRLVDRDGNVLSEDIARSPAPGSKEGLFDPEGGFDLA